MIDPAIEARLEALGPDHEAVFLVRFRSLVSSVRVAEIRAAAWPARRVVEEHEGYLAEDALLLRIEPRQEVPFPLRLHGERPEDSSFLERVRRASRVFLRATALAETRPRRAEQAFLSLESLFEEIGPDAAASMWLEAARTFVSLGDEDRAARSSRRLAQLARRAPVSTALLLNAVSSHRYGKTPPSDLVDVAAERVGPRAGFSLRLGVLRRHLEAGIDVPAGTMASLATAAETSGDRADVESRIDAALLGCFGLAGTWAPDGEATSVRARLADLWAHAHTSDEQGTQLRETLARALRETLADLDVPRLSAVVDVVLPARRNEDAPLLLDVTLRLLDATRSEPTTRAEDTCIRALLHLAEIAAPQLLERADEVGRALADAFEEPTSRPLLVAFLADLDTAARRSAPPFVLSEALDRASGSRLGPADTSPPPRSGLRTDHVRSLARWFPAPLVPRMARALAAHAEGPALEALTPSNALAFALALRLVGLAQDERTTVHLAEESLSLAASLARRIDPRLVSTKDLSAADPRLHLAAPDGDALLRGITFSRASLADRGALRPERWPSPALPGLSDPRETRFVLLAWVLEALEAREAGSHHLAFARIAEATPLVRAGAGRLLPSPLALRGRSSSLARLASTTVARISPTHDPSLRDVILLGSPRDLAEAFAHDLGLSPHLLPARTSPHTPHLAPRAPHVPRDLPLPDLDPARLLAALFPKHPTPAPLPLPPRDPALPRSPVIAGHVLSIGPLCELCVLARGASSPRTRIPPAVGKDEQYRALVRGRRAERARRHDVARSLEARMISAEPLAADELAFLLDDPLHASLLRHLVIAKSSLDPELPRDFSLLWTWERARGLGVVPLDYDARWLGWTAIEIVHPARLLDVAAWRAFLDDLGVKQELPQLFRDLRGVPEDELAKAESHVLAHRLAGAAALRRALQDEGFCTGPGLATRVFVHASSERALSAWFDPGSAPWPHDAALVGAFGFRDANGAGLPFTRVPWPLVCEARASIERALARAAPRAR